MQYCRGVRPSSSTLLHAMFEMPFGCILDLASRDEGQRKRTKYNLIIRQIASWGKGLVFRVTATVEGVRRFSPVASLAIVNERQDFTLK